MGEFYTRKRLRLENYDYGTNGFYFITICTKDKKNIFGSINFDKEAKVLLSNKGLVVKKYIENIPEMKIYIIMPNHIHMILELENSNKNISKIVSSLKILTSKELGKSIWHRSFHDRVIRNERELELIWDYVEHNPERWRDDTYFVE